MKPADWDDGLAEPVELREVVVVVAVVLGLFAGAALFGALGCRIGRAR